MLPSPEEMKTGLAWRNPAAVDLPPLIFTPIKGSAFDSPLQEFLLEFPRVWARQFLEICHRREG